MLCHAYNSNLITEIMKVFTTYICCLTLVFLFVKKVGAVTNESKFTIGQDEETRLKEQSTGFHQNFPNRVNHSSTLDTDAFNVNFPIAKTNKTRQNFPKWNETLDISKTSYVNESSLQNVPSFWTNIVKEIPTLDVGPLAVMTVAVNSTTVLRCSHQPLLPKDKVRLILWYRNDTTRPFLSYDARKEEDEEGKKRLKGQSQFFLEYERDVLSLFSEESFENDERILLGKDGESFILKNVVVSDQAEYRCKVHYKTSPSFTYRLQLVVEEFIDDIRLLNRSGTTLEGQVGPFSDGKQLSLICRIQLENCNFRNLEWVINGETLPAIMERHNNSLSLTLNFSLKQSYAFGMLYCRLTCLGPKSTGLIMREKATQILMFYVPQVTLLVNANATEGVQTWPAAGKGGAKVEVTEGQKVEFLCNVRAKPPSYNITWLRNGIHVNSLKNRIMIQKANMKITEVKRRDDGLYTCLASNSEGDGQSNAVLLRVRFFPRCSIEEKNAIIVPRNISVFLECNFEAEPRNVTFTWHQMKITGDKSSFKSSRNFHNGDGGIITGDTPSIPPFPKFIDLTPDKDDDLLDEEKNIKPPVVEGPPLDFQKDPKVPTRSYLKVVPQNDPEGYVCFAKNSVGHSTVPCVFNLGVVDPPPPPKGCRVDYSGINSIKVRCQNVPNREKVLVAKPSPDISPVRALETRTAAILEVWALGTLVANVSSEKGSWLVENLTPDTDLRLRICSTSLNAYSVPVVLYSRTKNTYQAVETTSTEKSATFIGGTDSEYWADEGTLNIWILIGVGLGLFSLVVLFILGWVLIISIIRKRKSRYERDHTDRKGFNDNWSEHSSSSQQPQPSSRVPDIQMQENPLRSELDTAVS